LLSCDDRRIVEIDGGMRKPMGNEADAKEERRKRKDRKESTPKKTSEKNK
jgi:hypothetical protein